MDVAERLRVVEAENAALRERVAVLERALTGCRTLPLEWGLTGSEGRVVGVLLERELATTDAIMAAIYRNLGKDEADPKIVDVFICKIRKKLRPYGVAIETVWGRGYGIPAAQRRAINEGAVAITRTDQEGTS